MFSYMAVEESGLYHPPSFTPQYIFPRRLFIPGTSPSPIHSSNLSTHISPPLSPALSRALLPCLFLSLSFPLSFPFSHPPHFSPFLVPFPISVSFHVPWPFLRSLSLFPYCVPFLVSFFLSPYLVHLHLHVHVPAPRAQATCSYPPGVAPLLTRTRILSLILLPYPLLPLTFLLLPLLGNPT